MRAYRKGMNANAIGYESGQDLAINTCDRLRLSRIRAGLEQEEMAEVIGVSTSTVSNWETGRTAPKLPFLAAWAQITGFNMSSLIGDDDKELAKRVTSRTPTAAKPPNGEVSQLPRLDSNQEPPGWALERMSEQVKRRNVAGCLPRNPVSWRNPFDLPRDTCQTPKRN